MDPLSLIFLVFVAALGLWFLNRITMDPGLRNILYILFFVFILVWLLQAVGVLHWPHGQVLR